MTKQTLNKDLQLNQTALNYKEYLNPILLRILKFSGFDTIEDHAQGVWVYDIKGRRFLDCAGGYGVFSLGHKHPKVTEAVKKQLDLMPLSAKVFLNKPLADLAALLAKITPGDLKYTFVCNSGAEAVEGALKLARLATGRTKIISAKGAFHGKTFGALSASGRDLYKEPFEPLLPDFEQIPFNDIAALEKTIDSKTAAVILEPIQGEGGIIVPSRDYLSKVRQLCNKFKALLVLDEIQTGLGRTGKLFACEYFDVVPDILLLAKALGGGVMPIGAFLGTPRVWEPFFKAPLIHTSTFGGNPLACVAAITAIKTILEENLVKKTSQMGEYLISKLKEVKNKFPEIISDVRGLGLMIGVEMTTEGFAGAVILEMAKLGVIGVYTLNMPKVIRFEPPLIINKEEIDTCVEAFNKAVDKTKEIFKV